MLLKAFLLCFLICQALLIYVLALFLLDSLGLPQLWNRLRRNLLLNHCTALSARGFILSRFSLYVTYRILAGTWPFLLLLILLWVVCTV